MKTKAVRLYGAGDLRLEEFELPAMGEDEILARVVCDSICMSTYKAAVQGTAHRRVPKDIAQKPVMVGHELCGDLVEVGAKWKDRFNPGMRVALQPALGVDGSLDAPGYSFRWIGGDATYIVIPRIVMEAGCLLPFDGDFFRGALAEPVSCVVGAFHASFHGKYGSYVHEMGTKPGGKCAMLGAAGPMGSAAVEYALNFDRKPSLLVVTDVDQGRLDRAESLNSPAKAKGKGVALSYVNTAGVSDPAAKLREIAGGGYDDVFVFAPVREVVELGDKILGADGCLNFFAGPSDAGFAATVNFYNIHYAYSHFVATSGGNKDDMAEGLKLMSEGRIDPSFLVTHVGGLTSVVRTTLDLPKLPGWKKLIYTHVDMPLTAISDFAEKGRTDPCFAALADLAARAGGRWSADAEKYLLANAEPV